MSVITKYGREGLVNEILYADDLVSMNQSMKNLREVFEMKRRLRARGED